jgi:hypothetical protein
MNQKHEIDLLAQDRVEKPEGRHAQWDQGEGDYACMLYLILRYVALTPRQFSHTYTSRIPMKSFISWDIKPWSPLEVNW